MEQPRSEDAGLMVDTVDRGRPEKDVLADTRSLTAESRLRSWWLLGTTFAVMLAALATAALSPWWPLSLVASVVGGLVMVRGFIIFHDFMHGSILRRSRLASAILHFYGYVLLNPARSWRGSHNFHHAHVGTMESSSVGSFPIMTTEDWRKATPRQRMHYRIARHPLTLLFAYLTVFAFSITSEPLLRDPRRHWDSAVALLVHGGILAALWIFGGFAMAFWAFLLPVVLAGAVGAYLFYVQHNFVGMRVVPEEGWSNVHASLTTCSYLRTGRLMRWFTGNIGYHHVHHLNLAIPFYRLPEAMAKIPELQNPVVTTLRPQDIWACLRLKLWDEGKGRMVGYRDVA